MFDPFAPDVLDDPYPWYRRLLASGAVHRGGHDIWVLSRYDDVRAAARDHGSLSSAEGVAYQRVPLPMMLTMDPPDHTRLRRIVARDFTPTAVERWRPLVQRLVDEAVERMLSSETTEVVAELAVPLPIQVVAEVLGIPREDYARFRAWSDGVVEGFSIDTDGIEQENVGVVTDAVSSLYGYLLPLIAERRDRPAEDLLTTLIRPRDNEALADHELFWFCLLLLVAGNETTTNLVGGMLTSFIDNPAEWERLRSDPALAPAAVEESLRFCSPVQGFFRTATRDCPVGDTTVPSGARVLLLFAAANRDPRQFADPDRFWIERGLSEHLGFGSGIHLCLGAHLARLEARVVLETLARRCRSLQLAGERLWTRNPTLRGLTRLPIRAVAA